MAGEGRLVLDRLDAGTDSAAAFMAEYQNQWRAQDQDRVFQAGQAFIGNEVAGNTHGEQVTPRGIERIFGGNARVCAAQYRHEGVLA
ncbi:hypothetical protein D3C72_2264260 [compost metagenome]